MSVSSRISVSRSVRRTLRTAFRRNILAVAGTLASILPFTSVVAAQTPDPQQKSWEFRISDGALVPSGDHRDAIRNGRVTAAQIAYVVAPNLAITGSFAWARSRDLFSDDAPKLDVFTSDVGVEARSAEWAISGPVTLRGFAGLGAGVRSYNHRSLEVEATNNLAGYGSVGGEIGFGRVGVRLEVRDYAAGFRPFDGSGRSVARNDVVILAALRIGRS